MKAYYSELKDKIKMNTELKNFPRRFNQAMSSVEKNGGYREKTILEDIGSIEINSHIYPGDRYVTARIYNTEGEGFEFIVEHETDRRSGGYKPGDITN